nr:protein FAR1-RELATED SEQUENCE 5-like [Ipomoea batatas]
MRNFSLRLFPSVIRPLFSSLRFHSIIATSFTISAIAIWPLRLRSLQFHSSNCVFSIIEYTFGIMDNISDTNNRIDAIELNDDITGDVNALIDVELSSLIDVESIPVGNIRGATEENSLIGVHASSSNAMDASSSIPVGTIRGATEENSPIGVHASSSKCYGCEFFYSRLGRVVVMLDTFAVCCGKGFWCFLLWRFAHTWCEGDTKEEYAIRKKTILDKSKVLKNSRKKAMHE